MAPNSIRFERFPVFEASGSAGGHDFFSSISFPPSLPFLSLRQKTLLSPPLGPKGEISDVAVEGVRFDFFQDVPYAR